VGLSQQVASVYQAEVGSGNIQIQSWPNAAVGVKVTSGAKVFGSWAALVAAAKIANPAWIVGFNFENVGDAGANETWVIDLSTGAAGSEVSLSSGTSTAQGLARVNQFWLSSVGSALYTAVNLPKFIKITGAPAVNGAVAGLLVGSKVGYLSFQTATGLGT